MHKLPCRLSVGLHGFIPQNNNFVVFNVYWSLNPRKEVNRHRRVSAGPVARPCTFTAT